MRTVWLPSKSFAGRHDPEVDLEPAELLGQLVERGPASMASSTIV